VNIGEGAGRMPNVEGLLIGAAVMKWIDWLSWRAVSIFNPNDVSCFPAVPIHQFRKYECGPNRAGLFAGRYLTK
jgi:hypothetical protein